ncbi:MAG: tetratricopeptide repeat protein [Halioglobus sp.]
MEPSELQIINELVLIRNGVLAIACLLSLMLIIRAVQAAFRLRDMHQVQQGESIRDLAVSHFESGKFIELVAFLKPKLRKDPNNATALYWMGRAYLELGNTAHAKVLLLKVKRLEPSWDEKYIDPYLEALDEP